MIVPTNAVRRGVFIGEGITKKAAFPTQCGQRKRQRDLIVYFAGAEVSVHRHQHRNCQAAKQRVNEDISIHNFVINHQVLLKGNYARTRS